MKPELFIGSSVEGLSIAEAIETKLHHYFNVSIWTDGVFNLGNTTIDDLLIQLDNSDFGVFVFTADDLIKFRGSEYSTARDNVIYELGLYTGKLGRYNTFIIMPSDNNAFHLPSDLSGVYIGTFDSKNSNNPESSVSVFCSQIKRQVINSEKYVFNGKWNFSWTIINSETYPKQLFEEVEVFHYRNKIKFIHNIEDEGKYIIEAKLKNHYLTGTWRDVKDIGYDGSFQMKLNGKANQFTGVWIGWNNEGQIKSGPINLERI